MRMGQRLVVIAAFLLWTMLGCAREKAGEVVAAAGSPEASSTAMVASEPAPSQTAETSAAPQGPSLVSFSAGALIVRKPQEYSKDWSALWILDERSDSGWATPRGVTTPQTIVVALPERTVLRTLTFDTASVDGEGRAVKDLVVEMSDQSDATGFQKIAEVTLRNAENNQTFRTSAEVPGRWVRLTVKNNYGSNEYTELFEFRASGRQLTQTPFPNASGTYSTEYGSFHLKQEGTSVTGCYSHDQGTLTGGIEGRIMKFTWKEPGQVGPAVMVFTGDGQEMFGLWWHSEKVDRRAEGTWNGKKVSQEVGGCPHWVGGAQAQLEKDLTEAGRARVYGINFDTDSDVIRSESETTLNQIVAVLKEHPDWNMTIEGHTDATGTPQYNRGLSERRAAAVRRYLEQAGIDPSRLKTAGFGADKPVAPNDTETGRAQNRRVELAKS